MNTLEIDIIIHETYVRVCRGLDYNMRLNKDTGGAIERLRGHWKGVVTIVADIRPGFLGDGAQ